MCLVMELLLQIVCNLIRVILVKSFTDIHL